MPNYNLGFISDENLFAHVKETIQKYRFTIDLARFNQNLIDPIKLTFDSHIYNKDLRDVVESEVIRQLDKSNNNHIGYFHQNIFKLIGDGWTVPEHGYDVINEAQQIYVEMKNKHNTMNSSSSQKTFMRMLHTVSQSDTAICMLVEVIAKQSSNAPWKVSLDGNSIINERILKVSIDRFYHIVTGDIFAFKKLCEILPHVITDVIKTIGKENIINNSVFEELETIAPENLLKSIFLLAFKNYQGFDDLHMG